MNHSRSYLTRLNGEIEDQPIAREHLAALNKFVMVMFDKDGELRRFQTLSVGQASHVFRIHGRDCIS